MRRGRIFLVALAFTGLLLLSAASAYAASPRQIYADLADNGRLDHAYSRADLKNAALDASVQGYGGVSTPTLRPVAQVAAANKTVTKRAASANVQARRAGTLPFTGAQLALFVAIGAALLASGFLLRRTARSKPRR